MIRTVSLTIIIVILFGAGCKEEMVGAPCVSETDDRKYNTELIAEGTKDDAITWSIETGSVQCATNICLTQTKRNPDVDQNLSSSPGESRQVACRRDPTPENCDAILDGNTVVEEPVLLKYSFCSCRCEDGDGNRVSDNPDKYDYLCECPPSAKCVSVLDPIGGISPKLYGSYCVPECIAEPCETRGASDDGFGEVCTPSANSEEPWLWSCEKITR